jgi:hypothetical protein
MKGLSAAQREALLDMLFAMRANLVAARSAKGRR